MYAGYVESSKRRLAEYIEVYRVFSNIFVDACRKMPARSLLLLLSTFVFSLCSTIMPGYNADYFSLLSSPEKNENSNRIILSYVAIWLITLSNRSLLPLLRNEIIVESTSIAVRETTNNINHVGLDTISKYTNGEINNIISMTPIIVDQVISNSLSLIYAALRFAPALFIMLSYDRKVVRIILSNLLFAFGLSCYGAIHQCYYKQQWYSNTGKFNDSLIDLVRFREQGLVANKQYEEKELINHLYSKVLSSANSFNRYTYSIYFLQDFFAAICLVLLSYSLLGAGHPNGANAVILTYAVVIESMSTFFVSLMNLLNYSVDISRVANFMKVVLANDSSLQRGVVTTQHLKYRANTITTRNLSFFHQGKRLLNVDSFELVPNRLNIVIGQSGSGKSTYARILTQLFDQKPQGEIALFYQNGEERLPCTDLRTSHIAYVSDQQAILTGRTIYDNLMLFRSSPCRDCLIMRVLTLCKLDDLASQMHSLKDIKPTSFSSGESKRLALARGLLTDRKILIIDEPTNGLDYENAQSIVDNVIQYCRENEITLVFITHDRELIGLGENIIEITSGVGQRVGV